MNFRANKTYFQKDLASILNREFLELGNRPVGLDSIETKKWWCHKNYTYEILCWLAYPEKKDEEYIFTCTNSLQIGGEIVSTVMPQWLTRYKIPLK